MGGPIGSFTYARVAKYTYTGDVHEIAGNAEQGLLPVFKAQSGFKAYSIVATDEKIISFSAWDSGRSGAPATGPLAFRKPGTSSPLHRDVHPP